ncbi:EAL domain-containing protein [Aquibacillus koreensis]|uniref:EAL domain-containing protein n=1 Tax=Aquibacillus koreensis TaxID=279446 RepID=A0A9X3WPX5_9BACI|nr:EAL domain-containing protein [Aquibacillus koreensis]MCT2536197.1 EAL domain-containing protein [Aquibacillus koreensis]MDC3422121.1 EAL domain-containing protein [Aquibacillus koreensis]
MDTQTKSCIECGLPFPIRDSGFLSIFDQKQALHNLNGVYEQEGDLYYVPYVSKQALSQLISTIEETCDVSELMVFTGKYKVRNHAVMIPFGYLRERVENESLVQFISSGNFISHFQPILNLKDSSIYGYESLLRSGDEHFNISPGQLFQVAQSTGLFSLLDQKARETAVQSRVNNIQEGVKSFINFLPSTIYNPDFCLRHTFSVVEKYNVNPEDLVFEVVETEKITDVDYLKKILNTYKRSGMKVALDDVGSGFATLEMLQLLQPDYVKIDRQYISYCDQDSEKQQFLQNVMHIANSMGIKVLAEGIEREEELAYCRSIRVDLAQGYFIGKPAPKPLQMNRFLY